MKYVGFLALLMSCSMMDPKTREQNIQSSRRLDTGLVRGDTKQTIADKGYRTGNCRGGEKSIERCEVIFWTDSKTAFLVPQADRAAYTKESYDVFSLTFIEGKLDHWEKQKKQGFSGGPDTRYVPIQP